MLVGGVIDHQLGDDLETPLMRLLDESPRVCQPTIFRMNVAIFGDIVTIVAPRAGIKRQQPDGGDADLSDVVQLCDQAREIADAIVVCVEKGFDVQLVDDRIFVPKRIGRRCLFSCRSWPRSFNGAHAPYCVRPILRQSHVLHFAGPAKAVPIQQVFDQNRLVIRQTPLPKWNFKAGRLGLMRIQIDCHQNPVRAVRAGFAEVENVVVEGVQKLDAEMGPEYRLGIANRIQLRDFLA